MSTWFESWFDSRYYHMLYANRDEREADAFIASLVNHLNLNKGVYIMDLGCGKGRHSVSLNKHGYKVLGIDLAKNSIQEAKTHENDMLKFSVGDMRQDLGEDSFDAVFNVFTSFGYFDDLKENLLVLQRIHTCLKSKGVLVIDFMNAVHVNKHLVENEVKVIDGVKFSISRSCDGAHFYKKINITDDAHQETHTERVQFIDRLQFSSLLSDAGFEIVNEFGNYALEPFDIEKSGRLIIHARKKA